MSLSRVEILQAINDLKDFWVAYEKRFKNDEVNLKGRVVQFALATTLDNQLIPSDAKIIDYSGFPMNHSAIQKIKIENMNPESGIVMKGHFMPENFHEILIEGLEHLGLTAILVEDSCDNGKKGVFIDVKQAGFKDAMQKVHFHLDHTYDVIPYSTESAEKFIIYLKKTLEEFATEENIQDTILNNISKHAKNAVFYKATEKVIESVEHELSSRNVISRRRLKNIIKQSFNSMEGFDKLVSESFDSTNAIDGGITAYIKNECSKVDFQLYNSIILSVFGQNSELTFTGKYFPAAENMASLPTNKTPSGSWLEV